MVMALAFGKASQSGISFRPSLRVRLPGPTRQRFQPLPAFMLKLAPPNRRTLLGDPSPKPESVVISVAAWDAGISLVLGELSQPRVALLPVCLAGVPDPTRQSFQSS